MKKYAVVLCIALAATLALAGSPRMGYINSDRIIRETGMVQDAKQELQSFSAQKEREATEMQQEMQELQQQLEQQQLMLSEERQQEMMTTLQQKYAEYQEFLQQHFGQTGSIAQKNEELMEPIMEEINKAVQQISEEDAYDFIFDSTVGLIYGDPSYDITDKIISILNAGN
ncbi:OmpH family outer membrane protein [Chitinivibrio alkaliphilus]|uniref:OmpH family outer membrane protein n=1 Tax=Chitinivibrio alkaliphilus ACht1 TaxID=1313304 RepID=U7D862_9BACT|nr:OmpH family outer membrane protein [Chitinivibrio alkaliphilus]ERP31761.1 ompH family outer membrane protein [Chitinivibrio alkaliphilus ACht1]